MFKFLVLALLVFSLNAEGNNDQTVPLDLQSIPSQKITFIQLAFDGINTMQTGVGTVVQNINQIICEMNDTYINKVHFNLNLMTCNYSHELPEFSNDVLENNQLICHATGGKVYLLDSIKNDQMFGDPDQWQDLCYNSAPLIANIINESLFTLIICHDTAFAQVPIALHRLQASGDIRGKYKVLVIPHATSWSYNGHTSEGDPKWPERHQWELKGFQHAEICDFEIGYINENIKNELTSFPFNLPENRLMHFATGILYDKYYETLSYDSIQLELAKRSIPLNKRLIFSIGRATPLKGQDIVLELYQHLRPLYPDIHLVMLAPPSDYMPEYIDMLRNRIKNEQLDVTLLDYFEPDLDRYIYQWPKTSMVWVLSRVDTQPLTVMEARANPNNCILLASNRGGVGIQINHNIDGFISELDGLDVIIKQPMNCCLSLQKLLTCSQMILEMPEKSKKEIVQNGKELIQNKYNFRNNLVHNLNRIFQRVKYCHHKQLSSSLKNLTEHQNELSSLFSTNEELVLKEIGEGMVNPPIGVFNSIDKPLGVLKLVQNNLQLAESKLAILNQMSSMGFSHLPQIYQNIHQNFVSKIGDAFYYCTEFLLSQKKDIAFDQMLLMTGLFHHFSSLITPPDNLKLSKLDEYLSRYQILFDPWLKENYGEIFAGKEWGTVLELGKYFASSEFQEIYAKLPKEIIHGDNNQTNVIVNHQNTYFVDLDSIRQDVRLLDLASYFRYGGFNDYCKLLKNDLLLSFINNTYGKNHKNLTALEKKHLEKIVQFSHLEFVTWAIQNLKKSTLSNDFIKANNMLNCIATYIKQLNSL